MMTAVHNCDKCSYFTKSVVSMKIHMQRHQSEELFNCEKNDLEHFSCENCQFTTNSIVLFEKHMRGRWNVRDEKARYNKGTFTKLVYNVQKIKLYRSIYGKLHKCKKCPYCTPSTFFLLNHVTRHLHRKEKFNCQSSVLEEYFCSRCQFSTNFQTLFRHHIKDCFTGLKYVKVKDNDGLVVLKTFKCDTCKRTYKSKHSLKRHIVEKHSLTGLMKRFECKQCEYKTQWHTDLKKHIIWNHTPEEFIKWFHCEQCGYKTKTNEQLKSHIVFKHTPASSVKWFECEQCEFKSKTKEQLNRHVVHRHTPASSVKWFECKQCEYRGKWQWDLNKHIARKHTSEDCIKWFKCDHCEFKTKRNDTLRRHIFWSHTSANAAKWPNTKIN